MTLRRDLMTCHHQCHILHVCVSVCDSDQCHILQVCVSVCVSDQCHITPLLPLPDTSTGSLSVSLTQVCDSLVLTPHPD